MKQSESSVWLSSCCYVLETSKKKLPRRTARCHYNSNLWASVTKRQSQRRRPIPWKWKCHSHPMSSSELCLFLVLVCVLRRLINTNTGLELGLIGMAQCVGFRLCLSPQGVIKSHRTISSCLCKYTVRVEQHVSVRFGYLLHFRLTAGRRGLSWISPNIIK